MGRGNSKNLFELENLEPRILLSADPVMGSLAAAAPMDMLNTGTAQAVEEVSVRASDNLSSVSRQNIADYKPSESLFAGLGLEDGDSSEDVSDNTVAVSNGNILTVSESQNLRNALDALAEVSGLLEKIGINNLQNSSKGLTISDPDFNVQEFLESRFNTAIYDYLFNNGLDPPDGADLTSIIQEGLNHVNGGDELQSLYSIDRVTCSYDAETNAIRFELTLNATRDGELRFNLNDGTQSQGDVSSSYQAQLTLDLACTLNLEGTGVCHVDSLRLSIGIDADDSAFEQDSRFAELLKNIELGIDLSLADTDLVVKDIAAVTGGLTLEHVDVNLVSPDDLHFARGAVLNFILSADQDGIFASAGSDETQDFSDLVVDLVDDQAFVPVFTVAHHDTLTGSWNDNSRLNENETAPASQEADFAVVANDGANLTGDASVAGNHDFSYILKGFSDHSHVDRTIDINTGLAATLHFFKGTLTLNVQGRTIELVITPLFREAEKTADLFLNSVLNSDADDLAQSDAFVAGTGVESVSFDSAGFATDGSSSVIEQLAVSITERAGPHEHVIVSGRDILPSKSATTFNNTANGFSTAVVYKAVYDYFNDAVGPPSDSQISASISGNESSLNEASDISAVSAKNTSHSNTIKLTPETTVVAGETLVIAEGETLSGCGTIVGNVVNNGEVKPGNSPGKITVTGDYTQSAVLEIEIWGETQATLNEHTGAYYDYLDISGTLSFEDGATLKIIVGNAFVPTVGQTFEIITFGALETNGDFSAYEGLGVYDADNTLIAYLKPVFENNRLILQVTDPMDDVTLTVDDNAAMKDQLASFMAGKSASVAISGSWEILGQTLEGDFEFSRVDDTILVDATVTRFELSAGTGADAESLAVFSGTGQFLVNADGVAAQFALTMETGSAINGLGFEAGGTFTLAVNTTGKTVTKIGSTTLDEFLTVNADGDSYFKVEFDGNLTIQGQAIEGGFAFEKNGDTLSVAASIDSLVLSAGGKNVLQLTGNGNLTIAHTGVTAAMTVALTEDRKSVV
jgi:hypothetical protein